jgi:hypothetical protein
MAPARASQEAGGWGFHPHRRPDAPGKVLIPFFVLGFSFFVITQNIFCN